MLHGGVHLEPEQGDIMSKAEQILAALGGDD
ncbi:PTS sugar transporter, partial [Staphylococcus aureus]|nr:PTS sugar transporter [Staphylococcus aureus]